MKLKDRCAIVTGGASGIGKALARRLAEDGANVVIADLRGAEETARELKGMGVTMDVTVPADAERMAAEAQKAFGRIDILVNNAALFSTLQPGPLEDITPEAWKKVMEVNTLGPFNCVKAVVGEMKARRAGRIINLASGAPLKGVTEMLHYVSSKGAMIAFTRALARELGPWNITVNALAPGFTLSEGILKNPVHVEKFGAAIVRSRALQREETPADLVGALSFLASDDAAFMTGQTLVVDGGSAFV